MWSQIHTLKRHGRDNSKAIRHGKRIQRIHIENNTRIEKKCNKFLNETIVQRAKNKTIVKKYNNCKKIGKNTEKTCYNSNR